METPRRLSPLTALAVLLLTAPAILPAAADAGSEPTLTVSVDCGNGQTIARALAVGDQRKPIRIVISGICNESVAVERSDVTLQAGAAGSGINGPDPAVDTVAVTGNRVTLEGLTVTGGRNGIAATGAAGLAVRDAAVQGTGRTGVVYAFGASGAVDGCTIQSNPRDGVAVEAGQATILNSTIFGNGRGGVVVGNGASARIGVDDQNIPGGNSISQNGSAGVHVSIGSSAFIAMNQITGNGTNPAGALGRAGVNVINATADIVGGNTIDGNAAQGVFARSASVMIGDPTFGFSSVNTITGNGNVGGQGGVFGFLGTSLLVRNAVIGNNGGFGVGLSLNSDGQISGCTIQNSVPVGLNSGDGIRLIMGSGLFLSQPNSVVSGNAGYGLQCTDGESSVVNTLFLSFSGNGLGDVSGSCTGF